MSTSQYLQEVTVDEHDHDDCFNRGLVDKHDGKQFCTLSNNKGPCLVRLRFDPIKGIIFFPK